MLTCVQAGGWVLVVQWLGWCCCAALRPAQPHSPGDTAAHTTAVMQIINFTIMILHGTHCCLVWSVSPSYPGDQCSGGGCRGTAPAPTRLAAPVPVWWRGAPPPPWPPPPPQLGPAVRNTKTSARERLMILVAGAGRP